MNGTVSKEFHFSYGHRLLNHPGKCANYHGHNAKVEVIVYSEINLETGMVIDFYDLNEAVKPIVDYLDHKMILQHEDPLILPLLNISGPKTLEAVNFPPTAENLATYLLKAIRKTLPKDFHFTLRFWETPSCYAEVTLEPR